MQEKTYTQEELNAIVLREKNSSFDNGKLHRTPSPETIIMFKELNKRLDKLDATLKPIADTYRDAEGFGHIVKWIVGILLGGGAVLAILKGIKIW